ncbi:MAG: hypothetical protein MEQ84_13570 [Mesorhizobium sp.]|nr:hypothetical protein [Mesorhizobium sp.]
MFTGATPRATLQIETRPLSLIQLAQCILPGIALLVILEIEKRIVGQFNLATDHARITQQNP